MSSLPVLDTLLCNLYVSHTGVNQAGKCWMESKKKSVSKQKQRAVFNEYVVVFLNYDSFQCFTPNQTKTICT